LKTIGLERLNLSFSKQPQFKYTLTTQPFQSLSAEVTITHPLGLHLRTGKEVVQAASQFASNIRAQNLSRESPLVDVKSILQLMQLQARHGHTLLLQAEGPDAQVALHTLCSLLAALGT
jgi:phosphotransferase system HPr (HPr) family protein